VPRIDEKSTLLFLSLDNFPIGIYLIS